MEIDQDNSGSGFWETGQRESLLADITARTWMRTVRQAPVEVRSALVLRLRPNCASPRARCVAPIRDARIGHDVNVVPRWGWGCPATDALARAPVLVGLLRGGVGVDERGEGRGGRWEGRCPLRARPSRLRRLHTVIDAAASCIGGIVERSVPRRRARWPAQCGAVDGEAYVETGGNVGGQGSVLRCMGQLRGRMHGCGTRSDVSACYRAPYGGKRALSWTVGMPEWGDVLHPVRNRGVGGMEESRAAERGLSASSSWKRWRQWWDCAGGETRAGGPLGFVAASRDGVPRMDVPCKPTPGTSAGDAYGTGGHYIYSGEARRGSVETLHAACPFQKTPWHAVLGAESRIRPSFCVESFQGKWVALDRRRAPLHARKQTRRVDAAETARRDGNPRKIPETILAVTCGGLITVRAFVAGCEKNLRVNGTPGAALLLGSGIYTGWRFGSLISVRLKTTGGARFDPLGLRRIMFNFKEVQHAVVNPAWDKKAGKF
ncbi:hypothetical protein B0H14DRAFT_2581866 [Mycena olivaceomarginata]|nr:hypothetical protein B0H14DRAFT_2581866 [Mycena olivaceomarginata]